MLNFLDVTSTFVILVLIFLFIPYLLYQWHDTLNDLKKEIINFHRLCKIFDSYLTRELNEEITEEETKRLSEFVKDLITTSKDVDKS